MFLNIATAHTLPIIIPEKGGGGIFENDAVLVAT